MRAALASGTAVQVDVSYKLGVKDRLTRYRNMIAVEKERSASVSGLWCRGKGSIMRGHRGTADSKSTVPDSDAETPQGQHPSGA